MKAFVDFRAYNKRLPIVCELSSIDSCIFPCGILSKWVMSFALLSERAFGRTPQVLIVVTFYSVNISECVNISN